MSKKKLNKKKQKQEKKLHKKNYDEKRNWEGKSSFPSNRFLPLAFYIWEDVVDRFYHQLSILFLTEADGPFFFCPLIMPRQVLYAFFSVRTQNYWFDCRVEWRIERMKGKFAWKEYASQRTGLHGWRASLSSFIFFFSSWIMTAFEICVFYPIWTHRKPREAKLFLECQHCHWKRTSVTDRY